MGVNTWDTANLYSNGVSEEIIGKAIKKYNIPRDKVVILTKCFWPVGEAPEVRSTSLAAHVSKSKDYINHIGISSSPAQLRLPIMTANTSPTFRSLPSSHP